MFFPSTFVSVTFVMTSRVPVRSENAEKYWAKLDSRWCAMLLCGGYFWSLHFTYVEVPEYWVYRLMRYSTVYVDSKQLDRHSSNSMSLHVVSSVAESADCCESCCCSHVVVLDTALFQWMLCFLMAEWWGIRPAIERSHFQLLGNKLTYLCLCCAVVIAILLVIFIY